jgi:hypothetical protein
VVSPLPHVIDKNQLLASISRLVIEMRISDSENFLHLAVDWFSVLIDSLGDGPMMSGELALMPRSIQDWSEHKHETLVLNDLTPSLCRLLINPVG